MKSVTRLVKKIERLIANGRKVARSVFVVIATVLSAGILAWVFGAMTAHFHAPVWVLVVFAIPGTAVFLWELRRELKKIWHGP